MLKCSLPMFVCLIKCISSELVQIDSYPMDYYGSYNIIFHIRMQFLINYSVRTGTILLLIIWIQFFFYFYSHLPSALGVDYYPISMVNRLINYFPSSVEIRFIAIDVFEIVTSSLYWLLTYAVFFFFFLFIVSLVMIYLIIHLNALNVCC